MNQDQEHLRLLSIFYYVYAGLVACVSCFFLLTLFIGIGLLINPELLGPHSNDPEEISDLTMVIFSGCVVLFGALFTTCLILVGRGLSRRKWFTFCIVFAGFICLLFPFGTILGVFSLIVLVRPSVRALFEGATPPAYTT